MQQRIARETKRDSSAIQSLSLLTMVFLPATAIAVSECTSSALIPVSSSHRENRGNPFRTEKIQNATFTLPCRIYLSIYPLEGYQRYLTHTNSTPPRERVLTDRHVALHLHQCRRPPHVHLV